MRFLCTITIPHNVLFNYLSYRSLQANNESSISDVSTTDNAQVSTVPDSSVNRPEENESLRQRVNASTARENSDDRRPEAPILSHIDRMTLGPPSHHRNRPKGTR